ncbi:unnamed protein product [Meloidogyne enterolobii]|uniref:Uncharacterized protein n=1 Tax=Meloidogyne enterolobii TaxID=390850 RepID=A0ACB0YRS4_MELEN
MKPDFGFAGPDQPDFSGLMRSSFNPVKIISGVRQNIHGFRTGSGVFSDFSKKISF